MKNNPVTKIYEPMDLSDHHYCNYGRKYKVLDLIELSKGCKQFNIRLDSIDLSVRPWEYTERIADLADHIMRMNDADLDSPVILDLYGYICDGWHRVVKALTEDRRIIKAVRLLEMPEDYEEIGE